LAYDDVEGAIRVLDVASMATLFEKKGFVKTLPICRCFQAGARIYRTANFLVTSAVKVKS
jgi:hypothetical protein